ncbi:MAG: nucleoside triphosphate pyrophosphohydrolase [Chloroflexales bacterium]
MPTLSPGRLLDAATVALRLEATAGVQLWAAEQLLAAAHPAGLPAPSTAGLVAAYAETQSLGTYTPPVVPFPLVPTASAIIWWAAAPTDLAALVKLLALRYPPTHSVTLATLDQTGTVVATAIHSLETLAAVQLPVAAYGLLHLPALAISLDRHSAEGLAWVLARLLGPGGCPWDVRQTHQSLRANLLEEVYEVLEALDAGDMHALSEELGDLLIAIFSHSEMARQAGHFTLGTVLAQTTGKLIGRHPHVFGAVTVDDTGQVLHNWEQIKAAELAAKGRARPSALDGVPPGLPALAAAQKLGKKAARAGFNWTELPQVWAKLREELDELAEAAAAGDPRHTAEELGDTLFVLTRLADWLHLDAEMALRDANHKFRRRFTHVEAAATAQGRPLHTLPLAELLALWTAAKG